MASFIEPPQTTDPLELLRHFQREAERRETPKTELPKGILERPSEEVDDKSYGVMKFFADWWSGTENKVAEARKEVLEGLVNMPMPTLPTPASEALDATLPGRESEPVIEGVAPDKPSMLKPEVLELEVDTRSNEALDKSNQTMSKAIEDVLETVLDSDASDSTDSADGGAAPSDGKGIMSPTEGESLMADPRGNKRPRARPEGLEPVGFKVPEYKVYNSPDEMSELEILARTIEEEARGEAYIGKLAVGATIANRAASGSYGKDIRGVILRRGQFSPWNSWTGYAKGEQGKDMMKTRASEDSYKAASAILQGSYEDPTDGATHYVNEKDSKPNWLSKMKGRKRGTLTIGNHLFGNADSNKKYDGKSYIFDRKSETTDQPVEAAPITIKAIQRIIGTVADGDFGPASRKKAREFLDNKGIGVAKSATDDDLMKLVVNSN